MIYTPDSHIEDDDFSNWPELLHERIERELEEAANEDYDYDEDVDD